MSSRYSQGRFCRWATKGVHVLLHHGKKSLPAQLFAGINFQLLASQQQGTCKIVKVPVYQVSLGSLEKEQGQGQSADATFIASDGCRATVGAD